MVDVGAAESRARRAWAAGLDWLLVLGEARVAEVQWPVGGERLPRAARARRQHAVEHVDAADDRLDDIVRLADTHQVARLVCGQHAYREIEAAEHRLLPLADRKSADRITVE